MTHNLWAKLTQKQVVSNENKAVETNRFFTRDRKIHIKIIISYRNNIATVLFTSHTTHFDFKYRSYIAIQLKNAFIYWNNNLYSWYYRILATSIWCTIWWKFFRLVLLTLHHRDLFEHESLHCYWSPYDHRGAVLSSPSSNQFLAGLIFLLCCFFCFYFKKPKVTACVCVVSSLTGTVYWIFRHWWRYCLALF